MMKITKTAVIKSVISEEEKMTFETVRIFCESKYNIDQEFTVVLKLQKNNSRKSVH